MARYREKAKSAEAILHVNPGGYAFAERADGEESVFIPAKRLGGALDRDRVRVEYWSAEKGPEGKVVEILTRGRKRVVGQIQKAGNRRWVLECDDPRIIWPVLVAGGPREAIPGQVVSGEIIDYPEERDLFITVSVERVLGEAGDLDTEIGRILLERGIDETFPEAVEEAAKAVPDAVQEEDLEARKDLRALPFMTIDPPDARDFDDAVCAELLGEDPALDDYRLHVAIADVSHYVREGTEIDEEATYRCFSTYLPDRAIPMLPQALSSHMCSLVPREDRLAMVVSMRVDSAGEVSDLDVAASVIHSRERLTYDEVARELVRGESGGGKLDAAVAQRVHTLRQVADRLRARRLRKGAVELQLPETKILLDEDDRKRIHAVVQSRASSEMVKAYNLIEELMLAANEAVGTIAISYKLPAVFRVHDRPDEGKLAVLGEAAASLGMKVDPEKLQNPRGVQKFLSRLEGKEQSPALNMLMLRAMAQAEYSTENVGHFALASPAYVHFTSPIRRYPDLISHRVIKAWLRQTAGCCGPKPVPPMPRPDESKEQARSSSEREREVAMAEREAKSLFAAAYMQDRIGERLEGSISGIAQSGVFVLLDDPFVDGMVKIADIEKVLGERFERDDNGVRLLGTQSGRQVRVGDRVVVDVEGASMVRRQVDFALVSLLSSKR